MSAARERLAAIPLGEMDTLVRPNARSAIESLKDRIVDYVVRAVAAAPGTERAEAIQRRLNEQGGAVEDMRDFSLPDTRHMHGASLGYAVTLPVGHPSLLAVVARFGIMCGEDALFFLFERDAAGTRLLMIRRSAPFREINGAWQDFRFAVSPPDQRGRWYVAISHTPPWCQSVWRSLTYDLSRPGPTPADPHIFFSRRVGHVIDSERSSILRAEADRFQVEHDGGILDPLINRRRHLETYALSGDTVRRVQPVAFNVRDFVDEWLARPWEEARQWSSSQGDLAFLHRTIRADTDLTFAAIRACGNGVHQVALGPDEIDPDRAGSPRWYIAVRGNGPYRIERAGRTPNPACRGADLREQIDRDSRRRMYGATF